MTIHAIDPAAHTELSEEQRASIKKIEELMNGPIDYYNSTPMATELDLVQKVRELFIENGAAHLLDPAFERSRFIQEAQGRPSHAQQYSLNRWIALQLMSVQNSDMLTRYALVYEIRPDHWLSVFRQHILPNMLALGLPQPIRED